MASDLAVSRAVLSKSPASVDHPREMGLDLLLLTLAHSVIAGRPDVGEGRISQAPGGIRIIHFARISDLQ